MYASIRRYRIDPKNTAELTGRVQTGFIPLVSRAAGFVSYHVIDAGDGVLASISIFEDRKGAEESNRIAADWVKRDLTDFIRDAPQITAGEVVVHEAK